MHRKPYARVRIKAIQGGALQPSEKYILTSSVILKEIIGSFRGSIVTSGENHSKQICLVKERRYITFRKNQAAIVGISLRQSNCVSASCSHDATRKWRHNNARFEH